MSIPLLEHQRVVVEQVLAQESAQRRHLVVHLSGAHAFGFVSPDSDVDLKAVHIAPLQQLLGLHPPRQAFNRLEIIAGVEIDYTSNELQQAVSGVLSGDGNMIERVLSATPLVRDPGLDELAALATRNLSRRLYRHYRGFASGQRKAVQEAAVPRVKKVLYVLRTTLTGAHLLETGTCQPDLTALCDDYGFAEARQLIEWKRTGEHAEVPDDLRASIPALLDRAFARLDEADERSVLPQEPPAVADLEAWLVETRLRQA